MPTDPHRLDKRLIRAAFERSARDYDAVAVLQREVGARMLERLDLIRVQPEVVLDLGAGTGRGADALVKRYPKARVIALDLALAMLRRARRRGSWLRRPRCVCGDIEALPFADASADMIFSNLTLQWSNEPERAFAEFRRVLRPGGLVMFSSLGPDTLTELRDSWAGVDGRSHVNRFIDMHDLGDGLLRAGLSQPVMDMEHLTLTYADALTLMRDLKRLGAHNVTRDRPRGLTGRRRLEAVLAAYEARRRDGVLPATYEVVYGHAWAPAAGAAAPGTADATPVSLERLRRRGG